MGDIQNSRIKSEVGILALVTCWGLLKQELQFKPWECIRQGNRFLAEMESAVASLSSLQVLRSSTCTDFCSSIPSSPGLQNTVLELWESIYSRLTTCHTNACIMCRYGQICTQLWCKFRCLWKEYRNSFFLIMPLMRHQLNHIPSQSLCWNSILV